MGWESELGLEVVGVPVRVRCGVAEAWPRLLVANRHLRGVGAAGAVGAEIRGKDGEYGIEVEGRAAVGAADLVTAIRVLHHEVLHAAMARARHLFFVHAGVVEWGGGGLVMPGISGAGKSTLVLALVLGGARFLSDEILAYDPEAHTALPFPRAIKLREVCRPYFPELLESTIGEGEGRFVRFEGLPENCLGTPVAPKWIVLPRWSPEPGFDLRPISGGEALLHLAESALNFGAHRAESLGHLSGLTTGIPCYRLRWNEPRSAAERLRSALGAGAS